MSRTRAARRGFTLLEVIIALAILVLAVSTILPLFAVGTTSHKRGMDQTMISLIAPHIAARIQDRLFEGTPPDVTNQEYAAMGRTFRYDATFAPVDPRDPARGAFIVKITVRWTDASVEKTESFDTILLRRLIR